MLVKFATSAIFILVFLGNAIFIGFAAVYTDQFVIHTDGGPEFARELAGKHGYKFLGQIFDGYYHLQHNHVSKRSSEQNKKSQKKIAEEPEVKWILQQTLKSRRKRDFRHFRSKPLNVLNDPQWPHMWYLNRGADLDMNVQRAWEEGIAGKGIVVTILDDGLEKDHPDIAQNYDAGASYDVNNHDDDPEPRYDVMDSNRHGTRCAGEVAAIANNSICAVGVAYQASVGGVRMLDGDVTDAVEARSLSLNPNHIDIYSASWGPDDDGKTVDGPGELATRAFVEGVTKGRNGLGSIFVWASGNGGRERDNCNCDGYTNSIWTLSISSATENGLVPWYSEACSSTLATTYSSGSSGERQIVTTDLHHGCTSSHTGTSASAPLAAGICALALQVNKNLTWRDMQHIVLRAARPSNLHAKDWKVNGVGRNVSHSFGYGLMDAHAMVNLAKKWKTVPLQKVCEVRAERIDKIIPPTSHVELSLGVQCQNVKFLEHVQAKISLTTVRRGDIHIYLRSPMGTRSTLLALRPSDTSRSGFQAWPFMTVHSWGENPNGEWRLEVHNEAKYYGRATLKEWSLILYGTSGDPDTPKQSYDSVPVTFAPISNSPLVEMTTVKAAVVVPVPSSSKSPLEKNQPSIVLNKPKQSFTFQNNALNNQEPADMPLPQYSAGSSPMVEQGPSDPRTGVHQTPVGAVVSADCILIASRSGLCLGCSPSSILLEHTCVVQCPAGYFPSTKTVDGLSGEVAVCLPCHHSCQKCSGPNDYQCSFCPGDSLLEKGYCYPKVLLQKLEGAEKRYRAVITIVSIFGVLSVVLLLYFVISYLCFAIRKRKVQSQYQSVPVKEQGDKRQTLNGHNNNFGRFVVPFDESEDEICDRVGT